MHIYNYNPLYPGYVISSDAMAVFFNRFARKRRHMHLDDFASCLSRVKIMDGEVVGLNTLLLYNYVYLSLFYDNIASILQE